MKIRSDIFNPGISFDEKATRVFRWQIKHNSVYKKYANVFGYSESGTPSAAEIPLLPVRAFRETRLTTLQEEPPLVFRSSGTSGMVRSRHEIHDPSLYRESVCRGFDHFYAGQPAIWACAPGYIDNPDSSLIRMLKILIDRDSQGLSRFLPVGEPLDSRRIEEVDRSGRKLILFGAAFGLIDLAEKKNIGLPAGSTVIETGGMKTRRREMDRDELHRRLAGGFGVPESDIHSEYGMCELLSQAYATESGWFETVPWMQVTVRNPSDPREVYPAGKEGVIGVFDLANLYSCSFILTEDRGLAGEKGRFQVLGRWNPENLRGCNFLIDRD